MNALANLAFYLFLIIVTVFLAWVLGQALRQPWLTLGEYVNGSRVMEIQR